MPGVSQTVGPNKRLGAKKYPLCPTLCIGTGKLTSTLCGGVQDHICVSKIGDQLFLSESDLNFW